MSGELRRLLVRHRQVAPMVSALLAGTDAGVTIRGTEGDLILERTGSAADAGSAREAFEVLAGGEPIGTVEGGRSARAVAAVLSYAANRERDARALAHEALDRYRELSLIYDLAGSIGSSLDVASVASTAMAEAARLPNARAGFVLLVTPGGRLEPVPGAPDDAGSRLWATALGEGIVGRATADGVAELVEDLGADERATVAERAIGGSLLVAPLRATERTIGALGTWSTHGEQFRAADLKVITAIAALTGPAIEQARRHAASLHGKAGHAPVVTASPGGSGSGGG